MKLTFTFVAAAVGAALLVAGPADAFGARGRGDLELVRPHRGLPPVSGTIHLDRHAFGSGAGFHRIKTSARIPAYRPHHAGWRHPHRFGPAFGDRGHRYRQFAADGWSGRPAIERHARRPWWQGDGTGLVGLFANDGEGEIDRETYPTARIAHRSVEHARFADQRATQASARGYMAEAPLERTYGEPDLWPGYHRLPPTGGLGYYNSGSPGRMAYYGSSSSAGPGGSPGGLAIYSSGSFGPGPRIIHLGGRHTGRLASSHNCFCGPHVIHVGSSDR